MGNLVGASKQFSDRISNTNDDLIHIDDQIKEMTKYGHKIIEPQRSIVVKNDSHKLIDLYPYLTYNAAVNNITSNMKPLEKIAYIISIYAAMEDSIKDSFKTSFEFKVEIKKSKKNSYSHSNNSQQKPYFDLIQDDPDSSIFTNILCGCSWHGTVYIIAPINNPNCNAKLYQIDGGYFPPKSRQKEKMLKFETSKYSFDRHFCCVISLMSFNRSNIINAIIFVNSRLDTIYGYHTINNSEGIKTLMVFDSASKNINKLIRDDSTDNDEDMISVISKQETVIKLWRQELDAFVLTSKFNLYGIKVQQNKFKMEKLCTFREALHDIKGITKYTNCWYDIDENVLFVVYKNVTDQSVQFKMYHSDRRKTTTLNYDEMATDLNDKNAVIAWDKDNYNASHSQSSKTNKNTTIVWDKESMHSSKHSLSPSTASSVISITSNIEMHNKLQTILNNNYINCNKSNLFHHKPSNTLLLFFGLYLIQLNIDFKQRKLMKVNIGNIDDIEINEKRKNEVRRKSELITKSMNQLNVGVADRLFGGDQTYSSINSEYINANPLPAEMSICDHIIGFDESRSCIILNPNQYEKEFNTVYRFKVNVRRVTDFASKWEEL